MAFIFILFGLFACSSDEEPKKELETSSQDGLEDRESEESLEDLEAGVDYDLEEIEEREEDLLLESARHELEGIKEYYEYLFITEFVEKELDEFDSRLEEISELDEEHQAEAISDFQDSIRDFERNNLMALEDYSMLFEEIHMIKEEYSTQIEKEDEVSESKKQALEKVKNKIESEKEFLKNFDPFNDKIEADRIENLEEIVMNVY